MLFSAMAATPFSPSMLVSETRFGERKHSYFVGLRRLGLGIFYIWLFKYFKACFWYRMTCNSVKTFEPKNRKSRPSGDEIFDWNCSLKLSVAELKN